MGAALAATCEGANAGTGNGAQGAEAWGEGGGIGG